MKRYAIIDGYMFVDDFTAIIDNETKIVEISKGTAVPELLPFEPMPFYLNSTCGIFTVYDVKTIPDEYFLSLGIGMTELGKMPHTTKSELERFLELNPIKTYGLSLQPVLDLEGRPMRPKRDIEYLRTVPGFVVNDVGEISIDFHEIRTATAFYTPVVGGKWELPNTLKHIPEALVLMDRTVIDFRLYQPLGYIIRNHMEEPVFAWIMDSLTNGLGFNECQSKAS
ncbi:hypothetical protein [Agrobacterium pusense]|uniref:hypothetical protein n=1 Tax=Agrobacterium pusense TaxID=648995 RepID=UPI0022B88C07|nr:hypothetical protein [Agrobacterium pusense]MCZ7926161.1 hypothetical protein [Agrobacterium pusense]